jgi:hypothetical protein
MEEGGRRGTGGGEGREDMAEGGAPGCRRTWSVNHRRGTGGAEEGGGGSVRTSAVRGLKAPRRWRRDSENRSRKKRYRHGSECRGRVYGEGGLVLPPSPGMSNSRSLCWGDRNIASYSAGRVGRKAPAEALYVLLDHRHTWGCSPRQYAHSTLPCRPTYLVRSGVFPPGLLPLGSRSAAHPPCNVPKNT